MPKVPDAFEKTKEVLGARADWNMVLFDFQRYSQIIEQATILSIQIRSRKYENIDSFYALLSELYAQWHGMMDMKTRNHFTELFNEINDVRRVSSNRGQHQIDSKYPSLLLKIWMQLHDFKQRVGLGLPMRIEMTDRDKLNKAIQ